MFNPFLVDLWIMGKLSCLHCDFFRHLIHSITRDSGKIAFNLKKLLLKLLPIHRNPYGYTRSRNRTDSK